MGLHKTSTKICLKKIQINVDERSEGWKTSDQWQKCSNEAAADRIVTSTEVIEAAPDIIIGSWCGKKLRPETFREREGWAAIPAVQNNYIYEVKSPLILQPGPAALTDGLNKLVQIFSFGDHDIQKKA